MDFRDLGNNYYMNMGITACRWISQLSLTFLFSTIVVGQPSDQMNIELKFDDSIAHIRAEYVRMLDVKSDSLLFLLNPEFDIDMIKSDKLVSYELIAINGRPFPFWRLLYSEPFNVGDEIKITFEYKINLVDQNHYAFDWIELTVDKLWFPNYGDLNNKFSYTLAVKNFPPSWTFIGQTDADITHADRDILVRLDYPWYEVLVLAGKDLKKWSFDKDITILARENSSDSTLRLMSKIARNSIDLLNRTIGESDPIDKFTLVVRNTTREELGYQTNRKDLIITGIEFDDYANLSHEIAHYWWNKANFIEEPWMNESFANYSMYKVLEEYDAPTFERLYQKNRTLVENAIPVSSATLFAENAYTSYYHKGAIHLLDLESRIGREKMDELLSTCITKEINSTVGFLDEIENVTNQENREFFAGLLDK